MAKKRSKKASSPKNSKQFEETLDLYFNKKAPALPKNWKEFFVKLAPYLAILAVIIYLPAIFFLFGLDSLVTVLAPFAGVRETIHVPNMWLSTLLLVPIAALELFSIPALFARKQIGWKYMYWAQILSIVSNVIAFDLFGAIAGFVIGFYLLFQIRSLYK